MNERCLDGTVICLSLFPLPRPLGSTVFVKLFFSFGVFPVIGQPCVCGILFCTLWSRLVGCLMRLPGSALG